MACAPRLDDCKEVEYAVNGVEEASDHEGVRGFRHAIVVETGEQHRPHSARHQVSHRRAECLCRDVSAHESVLLRPLDLDSERRAGLLHQVGAVEAMTPARRAADEHCRQQRELRKKRRHYSGEVTRELWVRVTGHGRGSPLEDDLYLFVEAGDKERLLALEVKRDGGWCHPARTGDGSQR